MLIALIVSYFLDRLSLPVFKKDSEPDQVKATSIPPEAIKQNSEIQHRGEPNPPSTTNRPGGKHGKQGSQASEPPKEEYIHVRARRGQATNSHSLAERVRYSYELSCFSMICFILACHF